MPWITIKNCSYDLKNIKKIYHEDESLYIDFHISEYVDDFDYGTPEKAKEAFEDLVALINGLTR